MESIGTNVATKVAETWVDKAMKEAHYLCCFKSYVEDFQKEKSRLSAAVESLQEDIKEAKNRNKHRIDPRVQKWLDEAKGLIQEDSEAKKKCFFDLCTNCCWQQERSKDLERKTQEILKLLEDSKSFDQIARSDELPGIEYHSLPDFIHFESRKSKFEELKETLKNENNHVIGLQGMGGTGKTTIATEVGKEVKQSKLFDKVIFIVVSNPPDVKKIRGGIASHLDFPLNEKESEAHAEKLWARIFKGEEKVLIILDDVWDKELDLKGIGIPVGRHGKGCCSVLLTTRDVNICKALKCHQIIQLELLSEEDALKLLVSHAGKSGGDSSNDFRDVGLDIVKECGRLPIAIVVVAKALYLEPLEEWKEALKRLRSFDPLKPDIVDEYMTNVYNSLRLSFDNLKNKKAQEFFLLCSLFPEDYEIPIELINRIAIGLGLCGEENKYDLARSQLQTIKRKVIDSYLLLKVEEECVKMHDLVHDVAHLIATTKIQVIMDSRITLKENIQYSSWNIDRFPNCFSSSKLEFLLVWVNTNDSVEVPNTLFNNDMVGLRVLILICTHSEQIAALSLMQSILPLRNIRTLILKKWELGDISIVGNMRCLEALDLNSCSINELPNEVTKLEKLRLLSLIECLIKWNNPLEVIARCPELEELYYVGNSDTIAERIEDDELTQNNITLPQLQRYHIVSPWSANIHKVDASISRCFDLGFSKNIFSEETFKFMAARATVLQSRGPNEIGWKNLIPDIIGKEKRGMDDLIRLSLDSWFEIECLINKKHLQSDVTIFSKLVELELNKVNVKELCCGPLPIDFLKQIERIDLQNCLKLESTLFKGKLDLGKLKSIHLDNCSMAFLFHPSTAQSLKQLEKLEISVCFQLEYILTKDDKDDLNLKDQGTMFPKLKVLRVNECDKLKFILPICFVQNLLLLEDVAIDSCRKLKCIFGQYPDEGSLSPNENEITLPSLAKLDISGVPNWIDIYPEWYHPMSYVVQDSSTISGDSLKAKRNSLSNTFSWSHMCCFQLKSNPTIIDNLADGSEESKKKRHFNIAKCLLRPPINPHNLRSVTIRKCSNLTSLFTLHTASLMSSLEEVKVEFCDELKHIIAKDGAGEEKVEDHRQHSLGPMLPKLESLFVLGCEKLEYIFEQYPGEGGLHQKEKEITLLSALTDLAIIKVPNLMGIIPEWYHPMPSVVPEYSSTTTTDASTALMDKNVEIHLNLPVLEALSLVRAPKMVNTCIKALSLKIIFLRECPQFTVRPFMDFEVCWRESQGLTRKKVVEMHPEKLTRLALGNFEIETIYDLERFQFERRVESILKGLYLTNMPKLTFLCVGSKDILSFKNLSELFIEGCNKLTVIFSASILRSLPQLEILSVLDCEELVHIIEENEQNPLHSQQVCFPQLSEIQIWNCKTLKCLFYVSKCDNLPKLETLTIEDAPELVQVFGCQQGETQHLVMKDVLPQLWHLKLENLQSLESFCQGIDFQKPKNYEVNNCPKFSSVVSNENSSPETDTHLQEASSKRYMPPSQSKMNATKEVERDLEEQSNSTPYSTKTTKAAKNEIIEQVSIYDIQEMAASPSNSDMLKEISQQTPSLDELGDEEVKIETTIMDKQNIEVTSAIEGPSTKKNDKATSSLSEPKEVCQKESTGDQEARGESISTDEASIRVDKSLDDREKVRELTGECSFKEPSSNKNSLTIPSAIGKVKDLAFNPVVTSLFIALLILLLIVIGNSLISSISTLKKSQIGTSNTQKELDSLQQYLSKISVNMALPWDKTLVNQTESHVDEEIKFDHIHSQQFEEDELIGLFQTMEEDADIGVHMPYDSENDAFEDGSKVAEGFADVKTSLEMSLNEIASSEENSLRLENALNFLSTYFSKDRAHSLSHDHKATIDSMHHQIQSILSSFKEASANIHTFNKLEEKENYINEELLQRKEAAITLISKISEAEKSVAVAQQKKSGLKEQISMLQVELNNKERAIKDYKIKLSSLQEQKKKSVSDMIRFMKEFEAVKKDKSHMMEDQIIARQGLEKMEVKWSSCVANLKKITLLLGTHLKQKL